MREDLRALFELQQTDDFLANLEKDRVMLADRRAEAEARAEEGQKSLEERKNALEERKKTSRSLEADLKETEEAILKFKRQEFDVKTNEALWALKKEIQQQEEKKSRLEEEALIAMDEVEAGTAAVVEAERELQVLQKAAEDERAQVERRLAEIDREEVEKTEERRRRQAELPEDMVSRYEKVRDHNRGVGVATVKSRACSGCYRRITPQDVNLIRRNDQFIYCEGCGAVLVWTDGSVEENS